MNVSGISDQRDLEGLSALVTGATSGIGRAAAEELGRHGAEIVVHGRDAGRGSVVVGTITAEGGKARFVAADLTDPAQVDHLAEQAGPVDVLVNNGGFSWFGPTAELDVATFDRLFAANVRSAYFLVAALGPKMAARGSGSIISLGSMAGQIGLAGGAAYGATKATLAAMTRSWAAGLRVVPTDRFGAVPDLPWTARAELEPGTGYLVMASHLPLKRITATVRFFRAVSAVRRQLATAEGLIGYTLRAKPLARDYWTLSVWKDDTALRQFMRTPPHVQVMTSLKPFMGPTKFVTWTVSAADGRPSMAAALDHLAAG